jgi:hypothetical protein
MATTVDGSGSAAHGRAGHAHESFRDRLHLSHDGRHPAPQSTGEPIAQQGDGIGSGPQIVSTTDDVDVLCGPLLNYKRMSNEHTDSPQWHGSVLIVTTPGSRPGELTLSCLGSPTAGNTSNGQTGPQERRFPAQRLFEDPKKGFWRYEIDLPFLEQEMTWQYAIQKLRTVEKQPLDTRKQFVVPSKHESMRIMFHSCNGFSVGTDVDAWAGPALWNDVLRVHEKQPFHIMIGGGDQIYNDGVRVDGPLKVCLLSLLGIYSANMTDLSSRGRTLPIRENVANSPSTRT